MSDFDRIEEHRELVTGLEYEDWRDKSGAHSSSEADGADDSTEDAPESLEEAA